MPLEPEATRRFRVHALPESWNLPALLGGGLDILLRAERAGGLRWPDLADSRGRVNSGALEESLPRLDALSVLSWDRGDRVHIPPQAMRAVLGAARRRGGVVVVDLPRRMDDTVAEALAQIDVGLLVVPAELRAVAAAGRVAAGAVMVLRDLRVVARAPFSCGLDAREIARLVGLPLAGALPPEPALADPPPGSGPPGSSARGPLARFCAEFLDRVLPGAAPAAGPGSAGPAGFAALPAAPDLPRLPEPPRRPELPARPGPVARAPRTESLDFPDGASSSGGFRPPTNVPSPSGFSSPTDYLPPAGPGEFDGLRERSAATGSATATGPSERTGTGQSSGACGQPEGPADPRLLDYPRAAGGTGSVTSS